MTESPHPVLSVIMPAYNEAATIDEIIEAVLAVDMDLELIIVDDGSSDGTRDILSERWSEHEQVQVVFHPQNRGKGAACRTGFEHARGDFIVIQDADMEYDPAELPMLVEPMQSGRADVVFGSRYMGASPEVLRSWHTRANLFFTWMSNRVTPHSFTDVHTCYKLVRRDLLEQLEFFEDGFGLDQELVIKLAKQRPRIEEIPISYQPRGRDAGKKLGVKDAVRIAYCIAKYAV